MTAITAEVDRFNRLASTWWDSAGPMRPLHVINRLRLAYLLELIDPRSIVLGKMAAVALQRAANEGALMAGICAGNLVLASAGVLKGVRATHNYTAEYAPAEKVAATAPYWDGILFERADIVEDGKRITAQPWAYEQFALAVARNLGMRT